MVDNNDPTKEHDVGQVGDIVSIDPSVVKALQDDQFIPVISPIGFGEDNESYNINADVVAGKLAEVLKAEKLMLLTNTPGRARQVRQAAHRPDARARSTSCSPTAPSPAACCPRSVGALDAAKSGVNAVHIIDGRVPHAMLLEILTDQAYGTMIRSTDMAPTLVTACTALALQAAPLPETALLRSVQICIGRFGAAALSPSGALAPWGGPAPLDT